MAGEAAQRAPRVVFLNVPAHGHVNPTLGIAAELVLRGAAVTYWWGAPHREAIEATGAEFRPYAPGWIENDMPHDGDLVALATVVEEAERVIAPALQPILERDRPDVIVHDSLAPWGKQLAAALHVPGICSTTTLVFDQRVALSRPALLARLIARNIHGAPRVFEFPRAFEKASSREPVNLVYTSRLFQPFGDTFDERFVFTGPIERDEPPLEAELAALERPIYVSFGTLFNDRPELFRAAAEGVSSLGHPVVMSTGGRLDPAGLGPMPEGVHLRRWVPQLRLLRTAVLAVTHAGMNTVSEALLCDVPLVVVPQAADQNWVGRRVVDLGAGVLVRRPTPDALAEAARRALTETAIREAARRIGASLREAGGASRAADVVLAVARKGATAASGSVPRAGD